VTKYWGISNVISNEGEMKEIKGGNIAQDMLSSKA